MSDTIGFQATGNGKRIPVSTDQPLPVTDAAAGAAGSPSTTVNTVQGVSGGTPVITKGWGFNVALAPTVTNGAYSAGDIVGGLLTFTNVAQVADQPFVLQNVMVSLKAAVTPSLRLVLFNANPSNTTTTDNAAYSLNAADTFKVIADLVGFVLADHGTPNTYELRNIGAVLPPGSGTRSLFGLLIDNTGVTLTSTSDVQITVNGVGA